MSETFSSFNQNISGHARAIITENPAGVLILASADDAFLRCLDIKSSNRGLCIDYCFAPSFVTFLRNLVPKIRMAKGITFKTPIYFRAAKVSSPDSFLNLAIDAFLVDGTISFECLCIDYEREHKHPLSVSDFCFCIVSQAGIDAISDTFSSFMREYHLTNTQILSLKVITAALMNSTPQKQIISLHDLYGRESTYSFSAIPSTAESYKRVILFVNKMTTSKFSKFSALTKRESEVLELASEGLTNRAIAAELSVQEGTVKKIMSNIYTKLGIRSRMEIYNLF